MVVRVRLVVGLDVTPAQVRDSTVNQDQDYYGHKRSNYFYDIHTPNLLEEEGFQIKKHPRLGESKKRGGVQVLE